MQFRAHWRTIVAVVVALPLGYAAALFAWASGIAIAVIWLSLSVLCPLVVSILAKDREVAVGFLVNLMMSGVLTAWNLQASRDTDFLNLSWWWSNWEWIVGPPVVSVAVAAVISWLVRNLKPILLEMTE